jgi:hypothetical protein
MKGLALVAKHLYLLKDDNLASNGSPYFFGVRPPGNETYQAYFALDRKISLKSDLEWGEVSHLQEVLRGAEIWTNFPAEGLKLISAEIKAGDEDQRVDILYLRDDGGLYPCEIKIGGESLDVHGQLIRYMADLHYQMINTQWLVDARIKLLRNRGITDSRAHDIEESHLREFLTNKKIGDRHIHLLRNAGIIVDEAFRPQVLKAIRYLNEQCGFSIRMLRLDAFAAADWELKQSEFRVRIDVVEVQ